MLKRFVVALCAVLLALLIIDRVSLFFAPCIAAEGNKPQQHEDGGNQACAKRQGIVIAGLETLKAVPPDWWTALAGIAVAFFTFTLWRSTDRLWRAGRDQIRQARSAAADQLAQMTVANDAARDSAEAAVRSARAAEQSLTGLERPYIFIFSVGPMEDDSAEGGWWRVPYTIANYGKTPAIIGGARVGVVDTAANGDVLDPAMLDDDSPLRAQPFLAAGETMRLFEPVPHFVIEENAGIEVVRHADGTDTSFPILKKETFFRAVIPYDGTLTSGHETGCLWRYMGGGRFALRGIAPNHNYQT